MALLAATDFDFVNARLHGLRSRLFEGDRLEDLLRRHTLAEVAQAVTGEALAVPAGTLERRLAGDHVADLAGLIRHLRGAERAFFTALLARYRTENLKVIVRWRADAQPRTSPAPLLVPLPNWLEVPFERLVAAPTMPALIEALPERRLARAAEEGLKAFQETGTTFFIEAALDRETFGEVLRRQAGLPRGHRRAAGDLVGRERDAYNVMFAARAALTHGLTWERVEPFLAPVGPQVGTGLLERIHAAADPAALERLIPAGLGGGPVSDRPAGLAEVERRLWGALARRANRVFYDQPFTMGKIVAYFYLKRVELHNVIRVVEGVRYRLNPADLRGRLIPARGG